MTKINFISDDRKLIQRFIADFSRNSEINLNISATRGFHTRLSRLKPDAIIFDLATRKNSDTSLLRIARQHCPHSFIVALVEERLRMQIDLLCLAGADEVIARSQWVCNSHSNLYSLLSRLHLDQALQPLRDRLRKERRRGQIVARSQAMIDILHRLPGLAASTSTVLITGETGTGKELIARALHYLGPRSGGPFVTVDCGALPEHLVENELFGHARGAYTGAASATSGLIAEANGGTLFLDEIEALPLPIQAKFLRFLQERKYKPLGQTRYRAVDVRILAATNIDLAEAVSQKQFRKDLYYRLNVIPLKVPPLRQRKADIPALVHYFLQRYGPDYLPRFPANLLQEWISYDWPGNVRELENRVQEWLALGQTTAQKPVLSSAGEAQFPIRPIAEVRKATLMRCEFTYLTDLLRYTSGNISAAARLAQIDRKNLRNLLKKHGIEAREFRS